MELQSYAILTCKGCGVVWDARNAIHMPIEHEEGCPLAGGDEDYTHEDHFLIDGQEVTKVKYQRALKKDQTS